MTSNLGSQQLLSAASHVEGVSMVNQIIHNSFKPEFINRLDEIIVFERLGEEQIHKIVGLQLKQLQHRLEKRGFSLKWDEDVVEALHREGYDPAFGARPLKRAIQRMVEDPLSVKLLDGSFAPGASIHLTMEGSEVVAR